MLFIFLIYFFYQVEHAKKQFKNEIGTEGRNPFR